MELRPARRSLALALLLVVAACETNKPKVDKARQIEIHTESAAGYMNMGEYERAVDQAMRGLQLDPGNFTLRLYLGRALLKRGGTQDVLQAEQIFLDLDGSEDFRVPVSLGEALERKGVAYDEASRGVATGERFTDNPDPVARAEELHRGALEAWQGSLEQYEAANALRANDTEVMSGLVRIYGLLGQDEESLKWADAILATTSTDRKFWQGQLERPNISTGEEDAIRGNLGSLIALEEAVLLQAASTAVRLDRPEAALDYLSGVIEIDPDVAEAHSRRAQLLHDLGRYEDAIASIDNFLRISGLEFEHPSIRRSFDLRRACERALELEALDG